MFNNIFILFSYFKLLNGVYYATLFINYESHTEVLATHKSQQLLGT